MPNGGNIPQHVAVGSDTCTNDTKKTMKNNKYQLLDKDDIKKLDRHVIELKVYFKDSKLTKEQHAKVL